MSVQRKKLELIEWLINIKDEAVINMLDDLRKKVSKSDFSETKRMSMEELLNELKISDGDFKTGNSISFEELEQEIKKL